MALRWLAIAVVLAAPARALACATCGCGDPTLTVMGAEQPFAGRLRFGLQALGWTMETGVPSQSEQHTAELRLDLSVAYAPVPWMFIAATMPLQARRVTDASLAAESALGPGDLDLRAKFYVFRDKEFGAHHLISVSAGARLPTSPLLRDAQGVALSLDGQLGAGSIAPLAGLGYSGFFGNLSVYVSATGILPFTGFTGFRHGPQVRSTVAGQYQLTRTWAVRLAMDGRWEGVGTEADGTPDPLGSGLMAYASPDVIFSPGMDVVLQLGVRVPLGVVTPEPFRPGPMLAFAVAYDR